MLIFEKAKEVDNVSTRDFAVVGGRKRQSKIILKCEISFPGRIVTA